MSLIICYHHKSLGVVCTDDRMSVEDPTTGEMKIVAGRDAKILQLPGGTVLGSVGRAIVGEQLRADVLRTMEHDRLAFEDLVRLVPEVAARHFEARTRLANPKKDLLDVLLVGFDEQQHRIRGYIWRSETGFEEIETTKDPGARIAAAGAFTDAKILQALTKHAGLAKWRKAPWYAGLLRDAINEHAERNPLGTIGRASYFAAVDRDGAVTLPEEFPPAPAPEIQAAVNAMCNEGGAIFVGSILTPQAGGTDTVGNNDGGAGAQTGNITDLLFQSISATASGQTFGTGAVTNPQFAIDGDATTFAALTVNGAALTNSVCLDLFDAPGVLRNYYDATFAVDFAVPVNSLVSGGGPFVFSFDIYTQDPNTFATAVFLGAFSQIFAGVTKARAVARLPLPSGLNLGQVYIRATTAQGSSSYVSGSLEVDIYDSWIEATE